MSPLHRVCPSSHTQTFRSGFLLWIQVSSPALPCLKERLEPGPLLLCSIVPACKKPAILWKSELMNERLYPRIKKLSGLKIITNNSVPQKYQLQKTGFYWLIISLKKQIQVLGSTENPYYSSGVHNYLSYSYREWLYSLPWRVTLQFRRQQVVSLWMG